MAGPTINATKAAAANVKYAARFGWGVKPGGGYVGPGDVALARDVAVFQYARRAGVSPLALDADGIVGQFTGRAMIDEIRRETADGKFWALRLDFDSFDFGEQNNANSPPPTPPAPAVASVAAVPPPPPGPPVAVIAGAVLLLGAAGWWVWREFK